MRLKIDLKPMDAEQVFTWTSDDGTQTLHFRASVMERFLKQNPDFAQYVLKRVPLDQGFARFVRDFRGLEDPHLFALPIERLEVPTISCAMPDGSYLLVDGHHRYYRRYLAGKTTVDSYLIPEPIWKHFLVTDATLRRYHEALASA